jgi:hypothetical protein
MITTFVAPPVLRVLLHGSAQEPDDPHSAVADVVSEALTDDDARDGE